MRVTIEKQQLHRELGLVQTVVERRAVIPVLTYVRMEVTDHGVIFTGTDLDTSLRAWCEARETEPGVVCLPARKLGEIVRLLPDEPVVFEGDETRVTLRCGRGAVSTGSASGGEFPRSADVSGP